MTWFRDDWLMTQSAEKKYDENESSSNSETDVDFNQVCLSLSESLQDVKTDIWQEIEEDADKFNKHYSEILYVCSLLMTRSIMKELDLMW